MIEFPCEEVLTHRGLFYRPKAAVRFYGPAETLLVDCIVDSGADTTVLTWQIGQYLGWTVTGSEMPISLGGISGFLPCYARQIDIEVGTTTFSTNVMWATNDDLPNLLGREGTFDAFNIEFRQSDRVTRFTKTHHPSPTTSSSSALGSGHPLPRLTRASRPEPAPTIASPAQSLR